MSLESEFQQLDGDKLKAIVPHTLLRFLRDTPDNTAAEWWNEIKTKYPFSAKLTSAVKEIINVSTHGDIARSEDHEAGAALAIMALIEYAEIEALPQVDETPVADE